MNKEPPSSYGGGGKAAHQQQQQSLSNPYLKPPSGVPSSSSNKSIATTTNNAAMPNTNHITKKAVTLASCNKSNATTSSSAKVGVTPKVIRNYNYNPYQKTVVGKKMMTTVTPTPKKQHQQQNGAAISSVATPRSAGHVVNPNNKTTPAIASRLPSSNKQNNVNISHFEKKNQPQPQPPRKKQRGTNLKSQLKSQIALLHRQKRNFIQQKQLEKQRLLQQKEMERKRIEHEKEMKRVLKLQQEEMKRKEKRVRQQIVGKCMNDIILGVTKRMEYERCNGGVHYAIGEVMESITSTIEQREKKKRLEKEKKSKVAPDVQLQSQQQHSAFMSAYTMQQVASQHMYHPMYHHQQGMLSFPGHYPSMVQPVPFPHHPTNVMLYHSNYMPYNVPSNPSVSLQVNKPSVPQPLKVIKQAVSKPPPTKDSLTLHPSPVTDPYSPYTKSHDVYPTDIVLTKKTAGESFGVILRWESKSALAPRDTIVGNNKGDVTSATSMTANAVPKKMPKQLVSYGVMSVVDVKKATFASSLAALHPGDVILSINGMTVGGMEFSDACRAVGATSTECPTTGVISCVFKVARLKPSVLAGGKPYVGHTSMKQGLVPPVAAPALPMIPFRAFGDKVIAGEFSLVEWNALVRGLSTLPHLLFSGMALLPVTTKEVLDVIQKSDGYGKNLQRRSRETLETKLAYEGKRIMLNMNEKAGSYWAITWAAEVQRDVENENNALFKVPLTDARRSNLRAASRPAKGCKCGSLSHTHVNDSKCPLYRDVKQYCEANSINISDGRNKDSSEALTKKKNEARSAMEKAYIDRFIKLRSEDAATREEAQFVLEMEKIQSSKMKKAVFAPPSLCTLVLSAVASVMDVVPEDGPAMDEKKSDGDEFKKEDGRKDSSPMQDSSDSDSDSDDSDDSDDEDVPLHLLLQSSSKRVANKNNSPPSKRPKQSDDKQAENKKAVPNPYFLAQILKIISERHGHVYTEPSHAEFAW